MSICRKDIARLTKMTTHTVQQNEKKWGLQPRYVNKRVIRYDERRTVEQLKRIGLI